MSTEMSAINPELLGDVSSNAGDLSDASDDWHRRARGFIEFCQLTDMSFQVLEYCAEVSAEMALLHRLAKSKVEEIEEAAETGRKPVSDMATLDLLDQLEAKLDNEIGEADASYIANFDSTNAELVAQFESDEDFTGAHYSQALKEALEDGDLERVAALTDALSDHIESMSYEDAKWFLESMPPEVMVLVIAESGIPPHQAAVDYAMNVGEWDAHYDRHLGAAIDFELQALIEEKYGVNSRDKTEVPLLFADELSKFADHSPDNLMMVMQSMNHGNSFRGNEEFAPIAAVIRDIAVERPDLVADLGSDDLWTQNFADVMVSGATDVEISAVREAVAEHVATNLLGLPRTESGLTFQDQDQSFRSLSRLNKAIRASGHGNAINFEAIAIAAAGELPGGGTAAEVLTEANKDELMERRAQQSDRETQLRNQALDMLCRTEPEKAQALLDKLGVDETAITGLTLEEWQRVMGEPEMSTIDEMVDQIRPANVDTDD